jgi:hypothetical protein
LMNTRPSARSTRVGWGIGGSCTVKVSMADAVSNELRMFVLFALCDHGER